MGTPKYLVVNDDIDISNTHELVWAFATRNHPGSQGALVYNDENTNPLVAYIDNAEKAALRTTKVIYNCLDPEHLGGKLPKRSSFHFAYPEQLQAQVTANWGAYGYPPQDANTRRSSLQQARETWNEDRYHRGGQYRRDARASSVRRRHDILYGTRNPATVTARAGTPAEAAAFGEVVIFAGPFGAWEEFAPQNAAALEDKVVIDASNPYPERDGPVADRVIASGKGSALYVAALLPASRVVKAFNTPCTGSICATRPVGPESCWRCRLPARIPRRW